ncbi:MAG TPA: class I SAM-dependent methyltransferase, partial [Candidatus Dormibacteraeota bacterium]|nr:class I SAM-dependent methyltransferase [Candidatus Dormibacteraeota bacterium]
MSGSVSFDRAADYYDQTRSLPDDLMQRLVPMLVAELPRDGRCLEIGVGTGRIALPLIESGINVVGVDISAEMLRRYVEKAPANIEVALADATRLPFADRTFTSAIASHVLHLIPGWVTALDELVRVVAPG